MIFVGQVRSFLAIICFYCWKVNWSIYRLRKRSTPKTFLSGVTLPYFVRQRKKFSSFVVVCYMTEKQRWWMFDGKCFPCTFRFTRKSKKYPVVSILLCRNNFPTTLHLKHCLRLVAGGEKWNERIIALTSRNLFELHTHVVYSVIVYHRYSWYTENLTVHSCAPII